jgi:transcriptional regulator with XRE-family HTH domain
MSKLKAWRETAGLSQTELSVLVGTSTPTICRVEDGSQNISADLIASIVKATKGRVTAADLLDARSKYLAKTREAQPAE